MTRVSQASWWWAFMTKPGTFTGTVTESPGLIRGMAGHNTRFLSILNNQQSGAVRSFV